MDERDREVRHQVGEALLRQWDPLNVAATPAASDEYDSYVGGVCRLLGSGASAREIAEHLVRIETESLGFADTEWRMLVPLAEHLQRLYARLMPAKDHDRAT